MSATMTRQGGRVQIKQSDMRLALNMGKMAKVRFSRSALEETQYLIKKPPAEVREGKKGGVKFPGHKKVMAGMERHRAMICQNHKDGCLPCQNGTSRNPQTRWRHKDTGAPPPVQPRHETSDPTPSLPGTPSPPGTPPAPSGPIQGTHRLQTNNLPVANADSHVPLPKTQPINLDALAEDSLNNEDFDPELLTDERTSCG